MRDGLIPAVAFVSGMCVVGVVLRFSSVASCAYTRGVRVESPIRPFLTQQIASYGKVMGRTVGLFPLILVCLLGVSGLLLGDFDEGIFGSKGGFLGLVGVRSVIGLPTGIIYSLKLYTLNSCLGFYFYVNQGGFCFFLGLSGVWSVIGLPI